MRKKAIFTIAACSIAVFFLTAVLVLGLSRKDAGDGTEVGKEGAGKKISYTYTWDPEETEVSGLRVNWVDGSITLKPGPGSVIRIREECSQPLEEDQRLKLSSSGGVLKIDWDGDPLQKYFRIGLFEKNAKNLTVEVPRQVAAELEVLACSAASGPIDVSGFSAEKFDLTCVSGDMTVVGVSGGDCKLTTTSGTVEARDLELSGKLTAATASGPVRIEGAKAGETEFTTVSGDVFYAGRAGGLRASSVSAPICAQLENGPKKVGMESVSGKLSLTVPESDDGFEVSFETISGSFDSQFDLTGGSGKSGRAVHAGGRSSFSFKTTSGKIEILKG